MKKAIKILWTVVLAGVACACLIVLLINWGVFGYMPSMEELENPSAALASEVYAKDGTRMGKFYYADQDRTAIDFKDISPYVTRALIATEDIRFYKHSGIDPKGVAAIPFYLLTGRKRGSSTITQQLALNLFGSRSSNYVIRAFQKMKEWVLAVKLERNFTKEEILALYLNTVPFSDNVYGIKNASLTFFNKNPDRLNIQEAASLIGMLKGPTLYNPRRNPQIAIGRRNLIINKMGENGFITPAQAQAALKTPIQLEYHKVDQNNGIAPYCREYIRGYLKQWCSEHKKPDGSNYNLYTDGLKIYTTIDPRMQLYANEAVAKHLSTLQSVFNRQSNIKSGSIWKGRSNYLDMFMKNTLRYRSMKEAGKSDAEIRKVFMEKKVPARVFAWNRNVGNLPNTLDTLMTPMDSIKYMQQQLQAGFMAMDPESGEIKAWVGGPDFRYFKNDHIHTRRQVGSTIKPFLYCLAIMNGFSPGTEVPNQPVTFPNYQNWTSHNDDGSVSEPVPMSQALARSLNNASAYLIQQLTPAVFAEFLKKRIRIGGNVPPFPSISLGTPEISLYEMMRGYSMFPDKGLMAEPLLITRIEDRNGNILENFTPRKQEIINQNIAYTMVQMMQGVVDHGTGSRMRFRYGIKGPLAGKTGTTNDHTDGWFIGYNPQLQFGAWVGCNYNFLHFNNMTWGQGASTGLPICAYFLQKVYADNSFDINPNTPFERPLSFPPELDVNYRPPDSGGALPGAEPDDIGNGNASDYFDVPKKK
ncbi:penicillin-binding protein 1A [Compostibacter hankyongensis]|uniref:Transglycosylase domain-containing protein n=1 Tax=Compostibacter hankyongensis TaxID=1007089 RepID=A0ABP8GB01_9BACT